MVITATSGWAIFKEAQTVSKTSDKKNITIDGQPALEKFEDYSTVTDGNPGCQFATYFMKGGVSY